MNQTLMGFIRKEFIQVLRDKKMRVILFFVPIVQLTIFGVAISTEVKNIRLAFHYAGQKSSDDVMSTLEQKAFSQNWFIPSEVGLEERISKDPFEWIQNDHADAVLVAPSGGLRRALERGEGRLQLLVNATNVLRAQSVEVYVKNLLQAAGSPVPISVDTRVLYNPSLETAHFMVPGVLSMILCVLTVILTSMSLAREKEMGTFETLISAPLHTREILFGKTLPYLVLGMVDFPLVLAVAVFGFGVPVRESLFVLGLAAVVFVSTTVSIGVLISTISKNQQQAMLGGFLFLLPAVLFSGIMFPVENMPFYMKWIAYIDPVQYFVVLLRNILLKGGNLEGVIWNLLILIVMSVASVALSFKKFKHTLG